uniref:Reverse transcriptase domain-containing protein n=1 Tax=Tanacetum cinerariifolium TaxID=118510 RepID=A0A6L2J679_TANCI|nr:reverse transcriptase domain-containing protein [Tanacetum cinerariifolium]
MQTISSSKLARGQTSNPTSSTNPTPKGQIRRSSKQKVENSHFEEHLTPVATMTDNRTMAEMLRAPTEGCAEAIIVPPILAEQFELKHSLINMMTSEQFFGLEKDNPHDHIRWFNKIIFTIKYKDVPNSVIKLILFPFSLAGAARRWLEKEPPRSITTWDDLVSKFINEFFPPSRTTNLRNEISKFQQKFDESFLEAWERYKDLFRACPHPGFTKLHQFDSFYNALNPADRDSLNVAADGNLLEKSPQDALTIIENKSKVRNSRSKPIASPVKACDNHFSFELAKLTHAVNQQTSDVTTAMTAMLKQFQSNLLPAQVKAVEEICVTCGGAHPYYQCLAAGGNTFPEYQDNIQGYVLAAACNYNQGNPCYRPQGVANQMRPPGFAQPNLQYNQNRFGQPQGFNRGPNFNQEQPYQATQSNQNFHLNELEKIKRMNDVSLKSMQNQIDMVKNELKNEMNTSIHTSLSNQTNEIKNMMASLLQMNTASASGLETLPGNTIANPKGELIAITTRSGLVTKGPTVPNPPKSINPEEDECVEETYTDPDLAEYIIKVLPPPVQKPKPPVQRNFVLHTRDSSTAYPLPEKLGDPGKFLIPCGFSELKCKALADLEASINLMPLSVSVWKKLGLPDLIPTRMTLELANRAICTPDGIARDVFVPVGKFTFSADFVMVDYESDPRVPLILGRPFLRTARALIDIHGEEMILRDGDERLTLNMKHDTASCSNHPHRELVNLINIFNIPIEDYLEDLVSNKQSGKPTFSLHKEIASPEVTHEIHDLKGCTLLYEELPDIDSFNDIHPYFDDDPLSRSTTYSANSLLEEFTDELALITYPPDYDDNREDSDFKDSIDQSDLANHDDLFVDPTPEMFTDEQSPDYSFPPRFDVYPDDFLKIESDADTFDDDLFDSKGEKIKEAELLIDQLDLPCDIHSEYDSFNSQDFSKDDDLPSPNNEDKDFDPPFYELLAFKEVLTSMRLLPFSSKNEEKVFKPGIYTSKKVKEYQEKDKIRSKPEKNRKRGEAGKSQKQLQSVEEVKLKKSQKEGPEMHTPSKVKKVEKSPVSAKPPYYTRKDFIACHLPGEWEISKDAELNPFKDTLVFRRMVEFFGAIPINLKCNMWESKDLIEKPID